MRGLTKIERFVLEDASAGSCGCDERSEGVEFTPKEEQAILSLYERGLVAPYECPLDSLDRHWTITSAGRIALLADAAANGRVAA